MADAPSKAQEELAEIREACEYDEMEDTGVDSLIDYKNALEERFPALFEKAAAWDAMDAALTRNARGESHASAADVCAVGFGLQERLSGLGLRERLSGPEPKWRLVRVRNGRLLEPVEGIGDVGTLVLYPEPGGHLTLVVDENSGRAEFTSRPGALGVSVDV